MFVTPLAPPLHTVRITPDLRRDLRVVFLAAAAGASPSWTVQAVIKVAEQKPSSSTSSFFLTFGAPDG